QGRSATAACAERAGVLHSAAGTALGLDECVVEARGDPALPLVEIAAHGDEMHDRKDLGLLVELALEPAVVGKQAGDIGMAPEFVGLTRSDQRVDHPALSSAPSGSAPMFCSI